MLTKINRIERGEPERVEIFCREISDDVREIVAFIKSRQGRLTGLLDEQQYEVPLSDIFYIESVDNKVFLYTKDKVYETKQKLYEFESALKAKHYLRVSKSMLLNLMKVEAIRPALNGRFSAVLRSGEQVIITRKYVPDLKQALKGGN